MKKIITTIVREHHWEPAVIGRLFLDDFDYEGLFFWYKDALECDEQCAKFLRSLKQSK